MPSAEVGGLKSVLTLGPLRRNLNELQKPIEQAAIPPAKVIIRAKKRP
jgi:hypothetical protein